MESFKRLILFWGIFLALVAGFLAVHLENPFYADDYYHLAMLQYMQDTIRAIWRHSFGHPLWRPLNISFDLLTLKIFGRDPFGWHLIDLFLHSFNALLVSALAYSLFEGENQRWRSLSSLLAGVIFAIHPIALLTTAWIACRADLMAAFIALFALLLLLSAIKTRKWLWLKMLLSLLLALAAFLSKETMMVLPGVALVMGFLFPARQPFSRRVANSLIALVPVLLALFIYLAVRLTVFGKFGGYETFEFSPGYILPRLAYHVPRVIGRSFQDYLWFHTATSSVWFRLLLGAYAAVAACAVYYLARGGSRIAVLGLLWVLISLVPFWNLSHMLVYGEARLLYFGLAGFALALSSVIFAVRDFKLRIPALAFTLVILVSLSANTRQELYQFKVRCDRFQNVKEQVMRIIPRDETRSNVARVYIYGLDSDYYYLDVMLKVMKPEWIDKIIIPASMPSVAWVKYSITPQYSQGRVGFPAMEIHYTDRNTAAVTVTPPEDLIGASVNDPQSLTLEWENGFLREISQELLQLSRERRFMQASFTDPYRLRFLPTYGFRKRNYPLDWKNSPGLQVSIPDHMGELYSFHSQTNDPYLISPELSFLAIAVAELEFKLRVMPKSYLAPQEKDGCFFWMTDKDDDWRPEQKICFPVIADGKFHDYRIRLDHNLYWVRSPNVTKVRLDPISFSGWFQLDSLKFSPLPAEANRGQ